MKFLTMLASCLLLACSAPGSFTYRYELVLEVETPGGLRTGTGVIAVTVRPEPRLLPDMRGESTQVRGEAVAVDLPGGQTLFATLNGENGGYAGAIAVYSLVPARLTSLERLSERMAILTEPGHEAVVERRLYPLLVRFRDPRDPRTIEGVDPDNLAASFGPGVHLRSIRVRTTRAEPTFSIQARLPWLGSGFHTYVRASNGVEMGTSDSAFLQR